MRLGLPLRLSLGLPQPFHRQGAHPSPDLRLSRLGKGAGLTWVHDADGGHLRLSADYRGPRGETGNQSMAVQLVKDAIGVMIGFGADVTLVTAGDAEAGDVPVYRVPW